MIPSKREALEVQGNLGGKVIGMSIDENSLYHIMDVLANLYSDSIYAVIREYSANALDSHIAAGVSDPIQVTLPTQLSPFLTIQDFGVGLNADDIADIYSKYGLSTKTNTNDQTGSLGLGSKSALAYTAQFTLIGIKDGISTTVAVGRNEEGVGTMTIVDQSPTSDHNGVTIIIPAKSFDFDHFRRSAENLFYYWPKGTVLLNGQEPKTYHGSGLQITPEITLLDTHESNTGLDYIIMGSAPYPVDEMKFDFELGGHYVVVAKVPMGTVHFTPSRDALNYTKMTTATLEVVRSTIKDKLLETINNEIDTAPTRPAALRIAIQWRNVLPTALRDTELSYRGVKMPDKIVAPQDSEVFLVANGQRETDYYGKSYRIGGHSRMHAIELSAVPNAVWVYGFRRTFTPTVKKKLWDYFDNQLNRGYPQQFIMCQEKPDSVWIEPDNIISWEPVDAIRLPRTFKGRTVTGRIPLSYDVLIYDHGTSDWEREILAEDIDDTISIYYSTDMDSTIERHANRLAHLEDKFQIVQMTANRIDKFQRLFPQAQHWRDHLHRSGIEWCETLTGFEKQLIAFHHGRDRYADRLQYLPQVGIEDPDINYLRRLRDHDPGHVRYLSGILKVFTPVDHALLAKLPTLPNPLGGGRYPLLEIRGYQSGPKIRMHNKIYVNAAYNTLYKDTTKATS